MFNPGVFLIVALKVFAYLWMGASPGLFCNQPLLRTVGKREYIRASWRFIFRMEKPQGNMPSHLPKQRIWTSAFTQLQTRIGNKNQLALASGFRQVRSGFWR